MTASMLAVMVAAAVALAPCVATTAARRHFLKKQGFSTTIPLHIESWVAADNTTFVAVAQYHSTATSKVYSWDGAELVQRQELSTSFVVAANAFKRGTNQYLALSLEKTLDSGVWSFDKGAVQVYTWSGSTFGVHSTIDVKGAHDAEYFKIGDQEYLATSGYHGEGDSAAGVTLFKWGTSSFQHHQDVNHPAWSRDAEHFTHSGSDYLVVANWWGSSGNTAAKSQVLVWDAGTSKFTAHQEFDTAGARRVRSFTMGSERYVGVAEHAANKVKLYLWDGTARQLVHKQDLAAFGPLDLDPFAIDGRQYMAVANDQASPQASQVFLWDGAKFARCQSLPSHESFSVRAFAAGSKSLLAVSGKASSGVTIYDAVPAEQVFMPTDVRFFSETDPLDIESVTLGFNDFIVLAFANSLKMRPWPDTTSEVSGAIPTTLSLSNVQDIEAFRHGGLAYLVVAMRGAPARIKVLRAKAAGEHAFEDIQTISGSWEGAVKCFAAGTDTFLVAAGYSSSGACGVTSKVLKFAAGATTFQEVAVFDTFCPTDFDEFRLDGEQHLVVSNSQDGKNCEVFKWTGSAMTSVQKLPVLAHANRVRAFAIDGTTYIAITVSKGASGNYEGEGVIYKWSGSTFELLQNFPVSGGYDIQYTHAGSGGHLLFSSNTYTGSAADPAVWTAGQAVMFRWDGGRFVEQHTLDTSAARAMRPLYLSGEVFVASLNRQSNRVIIHLVQEPVVFQHFRFRAEKVKGDYALRPMISEVAFLHEGSEVSREGLTAACPGGTFDSAAQGPRSVADGDLSTSWYPSNNPSSDRVHLLLSFPAPIFADKFKFGAGSSSDNVPSRWVLEGWDGSVWVTVHTTLNQANAALSGGWTSEYPLQVQREHIVRVAVSYSDRVASEDVSFINLVNSQNHLAVRWAFRWSEKRYAINQQTTLGWGPELGIRDEWPWDVAPSEWPVAEIVVSAQRFTFSIGGVRRKEYEYNRDFGWPIWQVQVGGFASPVVSTVTQSEMAWFPVFRQKWPTRFAADEWSKSPQEPLADNFAALDRLENHRFGGDLTFRMQWPGAGLHEQVWTQSSNPVLGDTSSYSASVNGIWGYVPMFAPYTGNSFAGLQRSDTTEALLEGTSKDGLSGISFAIGLTSAATAATGPCETQADLTSSCKTAENIQLHVASPLAGWELTGMAQKGSVFRKTILSNNWDGIAMKRNVTGVTFRLLATSGLRIGLTSDAIDDQTFAKGCSLKFDGQGKVELPSGDAAYTTNDAYTFFLRWGTVTILHRSAVVKDCTSVGAGGSSLIFKAFMKDRLAGIEILDFWQEGGGTCGATSNQMTSSSTLASSTISGSTHAELDAACCRQCVDSSSCVFWQREHKVSSSVTCQVMGRPTGRTAGDKSWRSGIKMPVSTWAAHTSTTTTSTTTTATLTSTTTTSSSATSSTSTTSSLTSTTSTATSSSSSTSRTSTTSSLTSTTSSTSATSSTSTTSSATSSTSTSSTSSATTSTTSTSSITVSTTTLTTTNSTTTTATISTTTTTLRVATPPPLLGTAVSAPAPSGNASRDQSEQAAEAARCQDDTSFSDERGLACAEWAGFNCSTDAQGYTDAGVAALLASCPVSCGLCGAVSAPAPPPPPAVVVEERETVKSAVRMTVDLSALSQAQRVAAMKASVSAALGVPVESILNMEVVDVSRRLADGRQLAGPAVELRYEVAVPPAMTARSIVMQATTLAKADTASSAAFSSSLRDSGVDTTTMTMEVTERPVVAQVQVLVSETGEVLGSGDAVSTSGGGGSGGGSSGSGSGSPSPSPAGARQPVVLSSCSDQSGFLDEQGEGCDGWVGYDCADGKWLRTERPYTPAGLRQVQQSCPLACGICSPPARWTVPQLRENCTDDAFIATFCWRWRGLNCSRAEELGFGSDYSALLLARCPLTCGACAPAAPPPCEDVAGYLDEIGFGCSAWAGYSCTKMYRGYTRAGILTVQAACPRSCGYCPGGAPEARRLAVLPQARETCRDDPDFRFAGQYSCGSFVGRFCSYGTLYLEPRWLMGARGIWEWHSTMWGSCPMACGRCAPEGAPGPRDLLLECEDDPSLEEWCAYKWAGTDCAEWNRSLRLVLPGEAERFNATLFDRCPDTCGLCSKPSCGPGELRDPVAHVCEACEPGRYAQGTRAGRAARSCADARPGFFVGAPGAAAEAPCAPGSISAQPGQAACDLCAPGTYTAAQGSSACLACEPGWYQGGAGATACLRCGAGSYASGAAASACDACPDSFTTELLASTAITACLCPEGTRLGEGGSCLRCPRGMLCPGGHRFGNESLDLSPELLPGMMSLAEDPFSIYTCIGGEVSCPGRRPAPLTEDLAAEVCANGRSGPRCHVCPPAHWRYGYNCKPCEATGFRANNWKVLITFLIQLWLCQKAYLQQGQVTTAAKLMFFAVISFCQVLYSLSKVPLKWPKLMRQVFVFLEPFGWQSVLAFLEFKHDCTFGVSLLSLVARDVALPILPFLNFAILSVFARLVLRRPMHLPYMANVIACCYLGLFINLSSLAVSLFPSEEMPNGKSFVRHHPGVEMDSEERMQAIPISLAAVAVYCGGFLAYTAIGVRRAPRAAKNSDFMEQYDYLVSDVRPNCYWWSLVDLVYSFGLAMVQALAENIYVQIYLSMLVILLLMLVEVHIAPSVHPLVNSVNCGIKIALFLFLAFSTAFIDVEVIDMAPHRRPFGLLLLVLIPMMAAVTIWCMFKALYKRYVLSQSMVAVKQCCTSRSAFFHIGCLPEKELVDRAGTITDAELAQMRECMDMVTAAFFGRQPSGYLWSQRIIMTGEPCPVMDRHCVSKTALAAISECRLQAVLEENAELRWKTRLVLKAATTRAKERGFECAGPVEHFIAGRRTLRQLSTGFLSHVFPDTLVVGDREAEPGEDNADVTPSNRASSSEDNTGVTRSNRATSSEDNAGVARSNRVSSRPSVVPSISWLMSETHTDRMIDRASSFASAHGIEYVNERSFVAELSGVAKGVSDDDLRAIFHTADLEGTGASRVCDLVTLLRLGCHEDVELVPQLQGAGGEGMRDEASEMWAPEEVDEAKVDEATVGVEGSTAPASLPTLAPRTTGRFVSVEGSSNIVERVI